MIFRHIVFMLVLFHMSSFVFSQSVTTKDIVQKIYEKFELGKYDEVIEVLSNIEDKIKYKEEKLSSLAGLIYYWKAMSYVKLNDYENAERYFIKSLALDYRTEDIYYEYGQVLYVASKYKRARIAFKKSVKLNYKVGVSLYYIAFISQELKDYKKAVSFYRMIEDLPAEDKKDVLQASKMQIGDIYLKQIERQPEPFRLVDKYVIPQYEEALAVDEESSLAPQIKQKILDLQKKYELILFRMRNGKLTAIPPYFLRANLSYGSDTNAARSQEKVAGSYLTGGLFARYSFYPSDSFSLAPEFTANYTKYNEQELQGFSNYFYRTALRMNYEHMYDKRPATFYIDFDYTYNANDANEFGEYEFSDAVTGVSLAEEVQFWKNNPSVFRTIYRSSQAELEANSYTSLSFGFEQAIHIDRTLLYFFNDYTSRTYNDAASEVLNTNILTNRVDVMMPTLYTWFNPTVYISHVSTSYPENDARGTPTLFTYGANINRPVGKKLYLTIDYSFSSQKADKLESDEFDGQLFSINLDYVY